MSDGLRLLRDKLCMDPSHFCRVCFEGRATEKGQNPPNVFRVGTGTHAKIFFIFDKPNRNDGNRAFVPIKICDPRFNSNSTQRNLLTLLDMLALVHPGFKPAHGVADQFDCDLVHITNAVKCDKSALTGEAGGIEVGGQQARTCISTFLHRELAIIQPKALVFFGEPPYRYVVGNRIDPWEVRSTPIDGRTYWVMRVPHTTATPFNSHGGKGAKYIEPFRRLLTCAGLA
jgi:hypothetical protein